MPDKNDQGTFAGHIRPIIDAVRGWWLVVLFVWVFLFAGIAVLGWGIWNSLEAFSSRSWPYVEGKVIQSQVASYQSESDEGTTTMFYPYLRYNYSVEGQQFTGDKLDMGEYSSSNPNYAEEVVVRYPVGKPVRIYYDPAHPETAVLQPGFTSGLLIPLGLGLVFTIVGGGLTYNMFKWIRKGQDIA